MTLAHPTVGQTSKFDTLGPKWRLLKSLDGPESRISGDRFENEMSIWTRFSGKNRFADSCLSYGTKLKCAGKLWPWAHPTVCQTLFSDVLGPISLLVKWPWTPRISNLGKSDSSILFSRFWEFIATLQAMRLAPKRRKIKFDTPLDAPGSKLSSALRISTVRQTWVRKTIFSWKSGPDWHFIFKSIPRDSRFWSIQQL